MVVHYKDVMMSGMAAHITDVSIVSSSSRKKTLKLRVTGLCEGHHWWPMDSRHKGPVTRKMFPFDDVILCLTRTKPNNARMACIIQWIYCICRRNVRSQSSYCSNSSPLDKMVAISVDDIFKCISWMKMIQISQKLFHMSPIDNKRALVQVMTWRRIDDEPLPEPMMTQFTDAYMKH